MESLEKELGRLETKSNLSKSILDVEKILNELKTARAAVENDPQCAQKRLLQAQAPIQKSFDKVNDNLKDIYNGLNKYSKAIKEKFKEKPLPFADSDNISSQPTLINRAIAMHLLREGLFDVATTFISEANANPPSRPTHAAAKTTDTDTDMETDIDPMDATNDHLPNDPSTTPAPFSPPHQLSDWDTDFSPLSLRSTDLQQKFSTMYSILSAMRTQHDLTPAIAWARHNSALLDARGSNLTFDLCRLQYITLSMSPSPDQGPHAAAAYARQTFPSFPARYTPQIKQLAGALAYSSAIATSPYASLFSATSTSPAATTAAAAAFTSEFCALLSLSSASPLLTAITAGCIALPTLQKFAVIQASVRTSWTTHAELPVEVPLPASFVFHSVFVCPVSKEQATDRNPPMMMPCGHVVARESLEGMSGGRRFKCPYCPREMLPSDAVRIYL